MTVHSGPLRSDGHENISSSFAGITLTDEAAGAYNAPIDLHCIGELSNEAIDALAALLLSITEPEAESQQEVRQEQCS